MTMKLAIYVQGCLMAGRRAWREEQAGDWDNADVQVFEGDTERLGEIAYQHDHAAKTAGAGTDLYYMRVAKTIREAI